MSDRVFIPSTNSFGSISKSGGILGLENSYRVVDDSGKRIVFVGKALENVVIVKDKKTGGGSVYENIPKDGVLEIRNNKKLSLAECSSKIKEYMCAGCDDREKILVDLSSNESDTCVSNNSHVSKPRVSKPKTRVSRRVKKK